MTGNSELEKYEIRIEIKAAGLSYINKVISTLLQKKDGKELHAGCLEVTGIVVDIGENVSRFIKGNRIAGIIPPDSESSGCAKYAVLMECEMVMLPDEISFLDAAAILLDGIKAYSGLHYQAHITSKDTVLVVDAATSFGSTAVQLAKLWGAKVFCTYSSEEEKTFVESLKCDVSLELSSKSSSIENIIMEESGGLGVNVILDNGVKMFSTDEDLAVTGYDDTYFKPLKHDLLQCLAVGGRWLTCQPDLQLDPPDCKTLYLKNASIGFMFEHAWTLSHSEQGRYLHILTSLLENVSKGSLKPHITKKLTKENVFDFLSSIKSHRFGKGVYVA